MEHFIAYHSTKTMGYELESSGELRFLSRKFGVLKKAIGNTVWVVQGIPDGKKTVFSLCGAYIADRIDVEDPDSNLYVIADHRVKEFVPPVLLNNLDWFPALLKSQSNFSLGFNRVSDETIVQALATLQAKANQSPSTSTLPTTGTEGKAHLAYHFRRERNRVLGAAKKAATLTASKGACVAKHAALIFQLPTVPLGRVSVRSIIWCPYQRPPNQSQRRSTVLGQV